MQSMTGYAYQTSEGTWGRASCEIRSLNHRYLDINMKLPDGLRPLEMTMRNTVRQYCERGRLEVTLSFQPGSEVENVLQVNTALAEQLVQIAEEWRYYSSMVSHFDLMEILKWPGVINVRQQNLEAAHEPVLNLLTATLEQLMATRQQEGALLYQHLSQRWQDLKASVQSAVNQRGAMLEGVKQRLQQRVEEANVTVDEQRFEQELVYWVNKADVSEEVDRLQVHIAQIESLLAQEGSIGRRIEFLLQEVYREANTIAAKSPDTQLTHEAVNIKAYVEQMREQIHNVE